MIYVRKSEFLSTGFTHKGVTLIELLLVISIFLIVGVTSGSIASNFLVRNNLQNKVNEVVSTLRTAQLNSISSKGDSRWGVTATTDDIILFRGDSYASRDPTYDEKFSIPKSVTVTSFEVAFNKLTGNPNQVLTVILSNNIGESYTVSLNEVGIVDLN
ncbi:hypothetical protein A2714_01760 [Candidatus Woesebacteria bacterium RIFCSPHIGHO2_01_FULL_38_9]|uniref:General secretion pathway GspH domain-containing protein n=2 Tax=Candidatus Woeseibacteriota TaxID=1752722 RepID=A0A1F7XZF5_9BACT|nr:MAG: hypothetical protein A2714_01760 [Candidatus Woesebacteria bacterium RIFCSPHIGHO2_01_FULL_38_9]OGM59372.1 MAG: hypothetical protein A3A75_03405 [Candidatus Woesebacteria bacterium RIFCSPLOWO2_01_FULL_39_10]